MMNTMLVLVGIFAYLTITAYSTSKKYEGTINNEKTEEEEIK